ncbi:helix-turn-helix domain-containing protein [Chryseobacterium gambrini]|uniref:Helix-turn-helix domain-containing protein n=1 Tax=Chryseobacterium gambrini TaxID=373672 RepID=A0AAJ1VKC9_9FLAO|nr:MULTISPECIES: helix-turn-helix domain-containing protein [Chryseobacterium]MDN4013458.1 helix-turn-helix domain-containing protein [Chryseobacterium gambrini]QWA37785.1 helix-turn-helix domain-containing protein [Chryseobacterium sp. ZHDP1]VXC16880.1 DNA binding domain-containing protein, excisionase family [Chryseobacterium sp. 8AT]
MNINKDKGNLILPDYVAKDILSSKEAAQYLDLSESSLYKLTSESKITFHKPNGGKLYFKKSDLDNWMLQNESKSIDALGEIMLNNLKVRKDV